MSGEFELGSPERVTVGTVGPVGQRAFFLQAREGQTLVTLKLEKQHVGALSERLGQLLQDLPRPGHLPEEQALELEEFSEANFVVGTLAVAYDASLDRVVLLAEELVGEEEDRGDEARLALRREQAAALAIRGARLVRAGRPPCPLCGFPLDPRGHACPRTNGHRPPLT